MKQNIVFYTINFNSVDKDYIVMWQPELVNAIVCVKFYHSKKGTLQKWKEILSYCAYIEERYIQTVLERKERLR